MRRLLPTAIALFVLTLEAAPTGAQAPPPQITPGPGDDIQIVIKGGAERRLAVAVPALFAPGTAALQAKVTDPFTATLRSDLEYAGAFALADPAHYPRWGPGAHDARGGGPVARDRGGGSGGHTGRGFGRSRVGGGARLGSQVAKADPGTPLLRRGLLRRADRPHAGQRPGEVLHGQVRGLSLDHPLRGRAGGDQGGPGHGLRRPQRPAADLTQVDHDQSDCGGRQDRLHLVRPALPADLDDEPGRQRQEGGLHRGRAQRLPVAVAGREPDRLRRSDQGQLRHLHRAFPRRDRRTG